jgi:hypothetical protein
LHAVNVDLRGPASSRLADLQPDRQELDPVQEMDGDVTRDLVAPLARPPAYEHAGDCTYRGSYECGRTR